jgi:hypothetical protein
MANGKKPQTTGEHIVSLYGHVTGLKRDICEIKNNHLKHIHEDIDKTAKKILLVLPLLTFPGTEINTNTKNLQETTTTDHGHIM